MKKAIKKLRQGDFEAEDGSWEADLDCFDENDDNELFDGLTEE